MAKRKKLVMEWWKLKLDWDTDGCSGIAKNTRPRSAAMTASSTLTHFVRER
jgi:hypothetical protein